MLTLLLRQPVPVVFGMAGVYPDSVTIEVGTGGNYAQRLVSESYVQGAWALNETRTLIAKDQSGHARDGAYVGTGFTRGVSLNLPEGALGTGLDGNGQIVVPGNVNLSLPSGSADLTVYIRTSTNDANQRGLLTKFDGTNGIGLVHVNGGIRYFLIVSGVTVFDFTRGAVSDGVEHIVHGCYEPEQNRCRIFIDGEQAGTAVTGTTEPTITTADMVIGGWSHLSSSATRFIGVVAFAMAGREGNPGLSVALQATRPWADLSDDVRITAMPITARHGIPGSGVQDTMARTGQLTFALDNSDGNASGLQGRYSAGHANQLPGFGVGIPVRFTITFDGVPEVQFRGTIKSAPAIPGINGEQYVVVTGVDWMAVAGQVFSSSLPVQINQTSDTVFGIIVDAAERPPSAIAFGSGDDFFPYAIDNAQGEEDVLMGELAKVCNSERSFGYVRGDGTLVYEPRATRQMKIAPDELIDTATDLTPSYDADRIKNIIRVTFYPRRVSSGLEVLAEYAVSQTAQRIAPGETVEIDSRYLDPTQSASRVGGTDMQPPVATTDYTMNTAQDGSGTNVTANFTVTAEYGGNLVTWTVRNDGVESGVITRLAARGKGIYHDKPQTIIVRDRESVRANGPRPLSISLPYQSSLGAAQSIGHMILNIYSTLPRIVPQAVSFLGNYDAENMRKALQIDIGDRLALTEEMTAVETSGDQGWFVQEKTISVEVGDIVRASCVLTPGVATGIEILDMTGFNELDQRAIGY